MRAIGTRSLAGVLTVALAGALGCSSPLDAQAAPKAARKANAPSLKPQAPTPKNPIPKPIAPFPIVQSEAFGVVPLALDHQTYRRALSSVPALAKYAPAFLPFEDSDVDAALRRGSRTRDGISIFTFQPGAFLWSPGKSQQFWVLSGRSEGCALIAVLHARNAGRLEHAASVVIDEPETTIALGYSAEYPGQLTWTTCYGCPAEGGAILLREDGSVEFTYR